MFKKFKFLGLAAALALAVMLAACGNGDSEEGSSDSGDSGDSEGSDSGVELGEKDLTVPYVSWAGAVARTNLIGQVLEKVGYNVDLKQVEAGPMWSSVADGSSDFMAAAWLPVTHQSYWEKYQDDLVDINQVIDKAPLALTVPSYMEDVNSIEDLKDNKELGESVDWEIIGIDPGAGIMQNTQKALDEYGLDNWKLTPSSEAAMITALKSAMEDEEPIVVPLWKPHWAFADMDLKMLEDPKETYGGDGDHIDIVANKDLEEKSPAAYKVLEQFSSDYDLLNSLMGPIHDGEDPEKVVSKFIEDNPDLVDEWTKGVE